MHGIAARYACEASLWGEDTDQVLAEQRFSIVIETLNGVPIEVSGQPDLVLLDQKHVIDYKTTKAVPTGWRAYVCPETDQVIREGPYALRRKYVECSHCTLGQHDAKAIEVVSAPRAKVQHALQVSLYRLLLHRHGHVIETAEIIYMDMDTQLRVPVEMLTLDEAERYLRERLTLAVQPDLPSVLTAPDEIWECGYCPVQAACQEHAVTAEGEVPGGS